MKNLYILSNRKIINFNKNPKIIGNEIRMISQYEYYGFIVMIFVLIFVFSCCINILIGVWVYKDAEKRNMDNPAVWLAVVLLGGCIGCIVYLIVREPKPHYSTDTYNPPTTSIEATSNQPSYQQSTSMNYCPNCGGKVEEGTKYCNHCGYEL